MRQDCSQPLRADSLDAIERLHTLWMHAGDPAAARAVLDDDGAGVHDAAPPDARPDIRMQLALYRLQIARHLGENDAVTHAIGEMHDVVRTSPTLDADRFVRARILDTLEYDHAEHALDAIELRHALNGALADRATFRAWDEANRQCLRAWPCGGLAGTTTRGRRPRPRWRPSRRQARTGHRRR